MSFKNSNLKLNFSNFDPQATHNLGSMTLKMKCAIISKNINDNFKNLRDEKNSLDGNPNRIKRELEEV